MKQYDDPATALGKIIYDYIVYGRDVTFKSDEDYKHEILSQPTYIRFK